MRNMGAIPGSVDPRAHGRATARSGSMPLTTPRPRPQPLAHGALLQLLGLSMDFWTINDPTETRHLLAMGADGIMTDDPTAIAPCPKSCAPASADLFQARPRDAVSSPP